MTAWMSFAIGLVVFSALALLWHRRHRSPHHSSSAEDKAVVETAPPPLHLGIKAHMHGEYEKALPVLRQHAELGNLRAQQLLARMYYSGHGLPQDLAQYQYWLEQAAEQGDRSARARLKALKRRET